MVTEAVSELPHGRAKPVVQAPEGANAPLRLVVDGLEAGERASFSAILSVLATKSARHWVWADGPEADLYLHTRGDKRAAVQAAVTGVLVRDDEPAAPLDVLSLAVPFRVMAVLELLDGAVDRLQQEQLAARATLGTATEVSDDKTLASTLARLLARPVEHTLRVRVLGFGTLYLCTRSRMHCMDFDPERLPRALEASRFVLTAIPPDSPELAAERHRAQPLDELLWPIGLSSVREHNGKPAVPQRLRQWPDFARLPHAARHLQACAALTARSLDAQGLALTVGMTAGEAEHFLHACELCGLLEADAAPSMPVVESRPAPAPGGLFDRLWRRLVK